MVVTGCHRVVSAFTGNCCLTMFKTLSCAGHEGSRIFRPRLLRQIAGHDQPGHFFNMFSIGWRCWRVHKCSQFRILAIEQYRTSWNLHESQVYTQLVMEGEIVETPEGETPQAWPSRALISWYGIRCQRSRHRWQVPSQDLKCIEITISHSESFLCLPFYCMKIPTQAQSAFTESHRLGFFCRQLPSDLCRCQWTTPGPRSWAWSGKLDLHGMESLSFNVLQTF